MADRSVLVRLKGDISDFNRAMLAASAEAKAFSGTLDTSTDRMGNLVQTSLALGPALVPIGAAAIPAISGLTNQLAFATVGAGVAALAFAGVGDALSATNDYAIEPTVANFEKMEQALATLGPAGREFVGFLQEIRGPLQGLQDAAQEGLFPGAEAGIRELMQLLPQAERIVTTVATTLGDLIAEAGDNLNDPRWREFFTFIENEAKPTLEDMGRTLGNFAEGFANLWMAFDPLSDNFSRSFLQLSRDFAEWTDGLSQTQGFQEFVDYVTRVGPKAWDTLSALGNALLQIVEAAAPVGEITLPIITAIANVFAAIADSPAGPALFTAAAGLSAVSRSMVLLEKSNTIPLLQKIGGAGVGFRLAAAGAAIYALSLTDLDEKLGVSNTATLAAAGLIAGPWGVAVGAGIGLALDLSAANDESAAAFNRATDAVMNNTASLEEQAAAIQAARDSSGGGFQGEIDTLALGELEAKHQANSKAAVEQKLAEAGLADAMAFASDEARAETAALLDNIEAKNHNADVTENAFSAETNYRQALKDANAQAKTNNAGIEGSSDAALKNREALDRLAVGWNRVADAGNATSADMRKAKASFIRAAEGMGVGRAAAKKLADELFHIPTKINPKIVVEGVDGAVQQIQHVQDRMAALNGTTAYTFVQLKESIADGGYVRRFADGGTYNGLVSGPGGPRDDKIPAMISNGEFVVNAAATAKNLGLLYEINSQRFADGGYASARRMADGGRVGGLDGATQIVSVSLKGQKIAADKDGLLTYVEGVVEVALGTRSRAVRLNSLVGG